jgi:predicted phosphodiesterase
VKIKDIEVVKPAGDTALAQLELEAKKFLLKRRGSPTLVELADYLDCSPAKANSAVIALHSAGYNVNVKESKVSLHRELESGGRLTIDSKSLYEGTWYRFGVVSDTHLYSKYARLDVLNCAYDTFEREKINTVLLPGNILEGECRFNKYDLMGPAGFEPAIEYLCANFPQRKGIVTKFITGDDHEGWWTNREGVDVGRRLEQTARERGRADLQYIGHVEADIHLKAPKGHAWLKIMHPGGGTGYATSYSPQRLAEAFQGGEKPHILLIGHYHKFNVDYAREIHIVQCGTAKDQDPFMRKHKIQAHVGFLIIEFHQAVTGEINRFRVEWFPFYDKGFYEKGNRFKRW